MSEIPNYFFYNGKLHNRLAVIKSDSSVLAFCFQEEDRVFLPLISVRKNYKKAFTFARASKILNVTKGRIQEIYESGTLPYPEKSYDLATFRPRSAYIEEEDMYILRDTLFDLLPKNKYGIPYNDSLASVEELRAAMMANDERDYMSVEGDLIRIWRA